MKEKFYTLAFQDQRLEMEEGSSYLLGRDPDCHLTLTGSIVSRKHAKIEWEKDGFILYDLESTNGTYVNSRKVEQRWLKSGDTILIGECSVLYTMEENEDTLTPTDTLILDGKISQLIDDIKDPNIVDQIRGIKSIFDKKKQKLSDMAFRDGLTGLFNRRKFDSMLEEEIERAKRYGRGVSLIMIDIDHFKQFNDTYGHQKGDEVLATVAVILSERVRSNDLVSRYGGEEMSVILPETEVSNAAALAENLRETVNTEALQRAGVEITISLGIAGYNNNNHTPQKLIQAADKALYQAKERGRNRVEVDGF